MIAAAADGGGRESGDRRSARRATSLRQIIDQLRRKNPPVAVLLANRQEEEKKVALIAGLSRVMGERGLDAVAWVKAASALVEGGGGGRPTWPKPAASCRTNSPLP